MESAECVMAFAKDMLRTSKEVGVGEGEGVYGELGRTREGKRWRVTAWP